MIKSELYKGLSYLDEQNKNARLEEQGKCVKCLRKYEPWNISKRASTCMPCTYLALYSLKKWSKYE